MSPRLRLATLAAGLAAVAVVVLLLVGRDPEELRRDVDAAGAWAPLAYVAATAGLTLAFFPFPVVAGAGGLLFGAAAGTALAVTGELIGASAAFFLARRLGADAVDQIAGPRVRRIIDGVSRRGFVSVLYVRILPGIPRHPANYAFGLTGVSFLAFVTATGLGAIPRAYGYAALGGTLGDLRSTESIVAVSVLAFFGALGLVLLFFDRRRAVRASGSETATSSRDDRSADPP